MADSLSAPNHRSRQMRCRFTFLALALAGVHALADTASAQQEAPVRRTIAEAIARQGEPGAVTIAGRASVAAGKLQATVFDIAVQDGSGGLRVFSRVRRIAVKEGDSIVATGHIKRYRGDLELVATHVAVMPAPPRPVPPRPLPTSLAQIARYPGQLVRVHGRVTGTGHSEGGQWLRMRGNEPGGRDTITIWVPANHGAQISLAAIKPNDSLAATGIVAAYQDNSEDPIVWQLIPRDTADVHVTAMSSAFPIWMLWMTLGAALVVASAVAVGRFTARRQMAALRETEVRYRQLLALSPDAVIVHARGTILFTNPAAAQLLGTASEQQLVGRMLAEFVHPDSHTAFESSVEPGTAPTSASVPRIRARLLTESGGVVDVEVTSSPCVYHDKPAGVMLARDIGAQLRHELDLHALALVDELTGLHNRRGFTLFAEQELARARRHGHTPVVVFADLDGLKRINDEHGHSAGDAALKLASLALQNVLRETDIVARWSGDEFVALMGEGGEVAANSIGERLDAALATLAPPGQPYRVSASVGTCALDPTLPLAEAMDRADAELYARKKRGRRTTRNTPFHVDTVA
jgi:diguanylate cyclase (GGDEF)-like protein/PAS domain S-box-containing protein